LKIIPATRRIWQLSLFLILMLLLSLSFSSVCLAQQDENCPPTQCWYLDSPEANCSIKDLDQVIAVISIPATGDEPEVKMSVHRVTKVECCENTYRCCDYAPCENTGCSEVPGSCTDNPGKVLCKELDISYWTSPEISDNL
jgi:hypothetical protein